MLLTLRCCHTLHAAMPLRCFDFRRHAAFFHYFTIIAASMAAAVTPIDFLLRHYADFRHCFAR